MIMHILTYILDLNLATSQLKTFYSNCKSFGPLFSYALSVYKGVKLSVYLSI